MVDQGSSFTQRKLDPIFHVILNFYSKIRRTYQAGAFLFWRTVWILHIGFLGFISPLVYYWPTKRYHCTSLFEKVPPLKHPTSFSKFTYFTYRQESENVFFNSLLSSSQLSNFHAPLSLWFIQMMWNVNLLKVCRGPWVVSPTALKTNGFQVTERMSESHKAESVGSLPAKLLNGVTQGDLRTLIEEATSPANLNAPSWQKRK